MRGGENRAKKDLNLIEERRNGANKLCLAWSSGTMTASENNSISMMKPGSSGKGKGSHLTRATAGTFTLTQKGGQWVPTEFLMMYYRERGRLPVSSPFPAEKKELEEDDNKRHPAANGDAPYPSPSTNMQAEIDAQLAITLHEAA